MFYPGRREMKALKYMFTFNNDFMMNRELNTSIVILFVRTS